MKFFNLLLLLVIFSACSLDSEDKVSSEESEFKRSLQPIVMTSLKLVHYEDKKFESSNTPVEKYFHVKVCFEKRLPKRKISDELWTIDGYGNRKFPSDTNGCVLWVETVKMDYSLSVGTFLRKRMFTRVNTGETITVNMHIDQYKNKITQGVGTVERPDTSTSTEGLVTQTKTPQGNTLANDPIKEVGDIQVLSNQDGHIPFVKYRISLLIPNRIANIYERLQGEPIQVRLERADKFRKIYKPVKELEGKQIRSAPYGSTNVAFDLEYNRYSPMRWIPYKLHILPLNPAFQNKGLTVDLCLKPWEGQKYSVYDATTFGSCPVPEDKSLVGKSPEIYFNHISFKQLGQVDSGYKLDEYLDISLRKRWRITVRPFVNYWHNFESNNHFFPLLSGNFKIRMILMAYNKGDTLELTQEDIEENNFDVVGYAETKARINKGNLIGDLSLDLPFQKWYRIYTRTFVAIQVLPLDEVENPYLKSGMALIPFHAADRDYSIHVKTDHFTEILDPAVNRTKLNRSNFVDKAPDMEMGSATSIKELKNLDGKINRPLSKKDSEASKGKVVFQSINRKFFIDKKKEKVIKNKLNLFFENPQSINSLEVGSGKKYNFPPEKTALEIMNSSPIYKPIERYFVDTKKGRKNVFDFVSSFLGEEYYYPPIMAAGGMPMFAPPIAFDESNYKKIDYSRWSKDGLDKNAKKIFCYFYIRTPGADKLKLENGKYSKTRKSFIYKQCLANPEVFIHVDSVSYVNKLNNYKFTTGMELRHSLGRRVYLFNSYNDRESMSGRINFALGFEKTNIGAAAAMGPLKAFSMSPVGRIAKMGLGLFNANFGGYDIGRYWGLDHSVGLSESVARSENISLIGTKHDVSFNADVRKCSIVRFKMPDEIATSFTYYDRANFVSFGNMMDHQLASISLWLGIDLGKRDTPDEQFQDIAHSFSKREKDFFNTIRRRFEFCDHEISKSEVQNESWYYLGSDLGYHSGTLDPLSIKHNPFMKLVRGTKNYDEVLDHLTHAIEATFIEEAKNFEVKDNMGELIKKIYKTPKYGHPPTVVSELINMVGLPGVLRRRVPTDNPYYAQKTKQENVFEKKGKVILGDDGQVIKVEKKDKPWYKF